MGLIFPVIACILGLFIFKIGRDADWHWGGSLFVALIPIAFSFMGLFGLLIGIAFTVTLWKSVG